MAFKVHVIQFEKCDKCGLEGSEEQPVLEIYQGARGHDRNMIFVHERCLTKAIEAAKKKDAAPR